MSLATRHDSITALHQVLCRLEESLVGSPVDENGFFGYHPLPLTEFLRGMEELGEPRGRFLDLGCGLGTKLLLAHYLGWSELAGVEHEPVLAFRAELIVPEATIYQTDACCFDCAGFDAIYTYRLCQDLGRQDALGRHIARTADPGTLVFYAGADLPAGAHVAESIWRV